MTNKKNKKTLRAWAPIWLLAFLFALPSCFEISCIKLTGCELFADDADDGRPGETSGDIQWSQPEFSFETVVGDLVLKD